MMASRSPTPLACPNQAELDWLLAQGIPIEAIATPVALMVATGAAASDGLFESRAAGPRWIAFGQDDDIVFWQPRTGELARDTGRAFALGESAISNPGTYAFDCSLNIFRGPADWLASNRDGIVVLDWSQAFDRLRDAPRIAIAEPLLPTYRRFMKPARLPELFVLPEHGRIAA